MVLLLPKMFEFAAPPRTGVSWFIQACREAGLEIFLNEHSVSTSFLPWKEQAAKDVLRVSLVRHPCDWLRSVFDSFNVERENVGLKHFLHREFYGSPHESFDKFVSWYLETKSGLISRIFDSYQADNRMRLEDMPWALVELLESFGVDQKNLDRVTNLPPWVLPRSEWRSDLRQQVIESEIEFCRNLDYY